MISPLFSGEGLQVQSINYEKVQIFNSEVGVVDNLEASVESEPKHTDFD